MSRGFIEWFRESSPYIHRFRNQTFVLLIDGEALAAGVAGRLALDLALLNSLGVNCVVTFGARPHIDSALQARSLESRRVEGRRVTSPQAMEAIKAVVGALRFELEGALTQGLANSPMEGARTKVVSGNFVIARPLGVIDGVDYQHTGAVRRVEKEAIVRHLAADEMVLVPPIGFSRTGELFNVNADEVAAHVATALGAVKLVVLDDGAGLFDEGGSLIRQITLAELDGLQTFVGTKQERRIRWARFACAHGVSRVHLVPWREEGALLRELFTRDGLGTLISAEPFEHVRQAQLLDINGIVDVILPLEQAGVLVKRSREMLETEIESFSVAVRDTSVVACAALYPFPAEGMAEIAALAVHPEYQGQGRGALLLEHLIAKAKGLGLRRVFVLSTQTSHWFLERGFNEASVESLPMPRQKLYNLARQSKVYIKEI